MPHSLTHPERLTITGPQGETYQGGDQEWYRDLWQRRRAAGPPPPPLCCPICPRPAPAPPHGTGGGQDPGGFLRYMEALWPYVTPGARGLDKPESLVLGCRSFALSRGCRLQGQVLEIPAQREARPSLDQCRAISSPSAWTRTVPWPSSTSPTEPSKTWTAGTGFPSPPMTEGESVLLCTILDEGEARVIDLALWWETSSLGGALAMVSPIDNV